MSEEMDRREAYRAAERARSALTEAAEALGFEDVHALADAARAGDLDRKTEGGARGITNAYSYLDNGSIERLLEAEAEADR